MLQNLRHHFLHPQEEYTPIPFWFWNDNLTEQEITRQIHDFYDKGVNGFVIHPRIGIPEEIEYLSDRFMELVTCAVVEAETLGMKVVLYDEAMYPSGSAHGMVVAKNPEYASKAIHMTEYPCQGKLHISLSESEIKQIISVQAVKKKSEKEIDTESIKKLPIMNHEILFETDEEERWSVLIFQQTFTGGHIRGIHFGEDDGEANAPASADLLNLEAMKSFLNLTHERYYDVLKQYFGTTIIGMFTDEPCIMGRGNMKGLKPWTDQFLEFYIEQGNQELDLPYLWFEAGDTSKIKRRNYEETVNKKMETTYYQPIYEWCSEHNIALTGHPHESDDIGFLKYFHMPAQDVVWRWVAPEDGLALRGQHSTMAKCSSDSARHRGKRRNGNECFACCGRNQMEWSFSADDMKWYMDWLFVRGVNLLFPHAFFYSIDGPRRSGERPPDVGPNNIWWPYYNQISDYMKRMSFLMTDSVNQARVAVLCGGHHLPWQMVEPLYEHQIEFNYLENEIFISEGCEITESALTIEKQSYQVLLIEDTELIDLKNQSKLQKFIEQGGTIIIYNPEKKELGLNNVISISSFKDIVNKINDCISGDVVTLEDVKDLRISHIKKDEYDFFVLVNEGEDHIDTTVRLSTVGSLEIWDAWGGKIIEVDMVREVSNDTMNIELYLKRRESIILFVNPMISPKINKIKSKETLRETIMLDGNWLMGSQLEVLEPITKLTPWNERAELRHYSGSMIYKNRFHIKKLTEGSKIELNLGEVYELPKVIINGRDLGVQMWAPYVFDITDLVKEGENVLMIEVKNTLANRLSNQSLTSGLIGPVSINVLQ